MVKNGNLEILPYIYGVLYGLNRVFWIFNRIFLPSCTGEIRFLGFLTVHSGLSVRLRFDFLIF